MSFLYYLVQCVGTDICIRMCSKEVEVYFFFCSIIGERLVVVFYVTQRTLIRRYKMSR